MSHKPTSGADQGDRTQRAQEIGLFRYALIRPVADPVAEHLAAGAVPVTTARNAA